MNELKPGVYKDGGWRLFIDSSKRSLKAVLLHNTNEYESIPIAHSTKLNENRLGKTKYGKHKRQICGDLKVLTLLLGQQSANTKYLCLQSKVIFKMIWLQK